MSNGKVASHIPSDYFIKRSTLALEDVTNFREIEYEPPAYSAAQNYYSVFWAKYLENEKVMQEI